MAIVGKKINPPTQKLLGYRPVFISRTKFHFMTVTRYRYYVKEIIGVNLHKQSFENVDCKNGVRFFSDQNAWIAIAAINLHDPFLYRFDTIFVICPETKWIKDILYFFLRVIDINRLWAKPNSLKTYSQRNLSKLWIRYWYTLSHAMSVRIKYLMQTIITSWDIVYQIQNLLKFPLHKNHYNCDTWAQCHLKTAVIPLFLQNNYSGQLQRKHKGSALLDFCEGIHRCIPFTEGNPPMDSLHKGPGMLRVPHCIMKP